MRETDRPHDGTGPGDPVNLSKGSVPAAGRRVTGGSALRWRTWNLLLLLPLLMLLTPVFNKDRPRLFGMPFFYWYQFAFVFVGVACVAIVFSATPTPPADRTSVEGNNRPANPDEGDLEGLL